MQADGQPAVAGRTEDHEGVVNPAADLRANITGNAVDIPNVIRVQVCQQDYDKVPLVLSDSSLTAGDAEQIGQNSDSEITGTDETFCNRIRNADSGGERNGAQDAGNASIQVEDEIQQKHSNDTDPLLGTAVNLETSISINRSFVECEHRDGSLTASIISQNVLLEWYTMSILGRSVAIFAFVSVALVHVTYVIIDELTYYSKYGTEKWNRNVFVCYRNAYWTFMMASTLIGYYATFRTAKRTPHPPRRLERVEYFVPLSVVGLIVHAVFTLIVNIETPNTVSPTHASMCDEILNALQEIM